MQRYTRHDEGDLDLQDVWGRSTGDECVWELRSRAQGVVEELHTLTHTHTLTQRPGLAKQHSLLDFRGS